MPIITAIIKKVTFKDKPYKSRETGFFYYGHTVVMENGQRGEIYRCTEARPPWLAEGKALTYAETQGSFPDLPAFIVQNIPKTHAEQNTPASEHKSQSKSESKKGGWGNRLEDDPIYWLRKQKFIGGTTAQDRATQMVIAGIIKYDQWEAEVRKHFNLLMELADLGGHLAPLPSAKKENAAPAKTETKKTGHKREETFSVKEQSSVPESLANELPLPMDMINTPVPTELNEKIIACNTKAKLMGLQKNLTKDQLSNQNIVNALLVQKKRIESKK